MLGFCCYSLGQDIISQDLNIKVSPWDTTLGPCSPYIILEFFPHNLIALFDRIIPMILSYILEKLEDEEDLRERSLTAYRRNNSPLEAALEEMVNLAKRSDDLHVLVIEACRYLRDILSRETDE